MIRYSNYLLAIEENTMITGLNFYLIILFKIFLEIIYMIEFKKLI